MIGLQDSVWYSLQVQQKQKYVTRRTSNKYLLAALTFCSFYFRQECGLIYIAENFVMMLVWQHTMHTSSYFCKWVLVFGYVQVHALLVFPIR
jgi:hypothetical protein